jgi:hypothetical protein
MSIDVFTTKDSNFYCAHCEKWHDAQIVLIEIVNQENGEYILMCRNGAQELIWKLQSASKEASDGRARGIGAD